MRNFNAVKVITTYKIINTNNAIEQEFKTLSSAKEMLKRKWVGDNAKNLLSNTEAFIAKYENDTLSSKTPIRVDSVGKIAFGRTSKVE